MKDIAEAVSSANKIVLLTCLYKIYAAKYKLEKKKKKKLAEKKVISESVQ